MKRGTNSKGSKKNKQAPKRAASLFRTIRWLTRRSAFMSIPNNLGSGSCFNLSQLGVDFSQPVTYMFENAKGERRILLYTTQ